MGSGLKAMAGRQRALAGELAALGNPLRLELFACFMDGAESPVEACRLAGGVSVENAAYHVRVLHRAGLLERAGERRKRGAVEHLYKATDRGVELFYAVTGRGVR